MLDMVRGLEGFIKEYNLVFTNTNKHNEIRGEINDIILRKVNYDNCISLFELVSSFNKLYMMFKKEYDELEKLDLGKKVSFCKFDKFSYNNDNYRELCLYIDEPKMTNHSDTLLYLSEVNGEMKSFVSNNAYFNDDYYQEPVSLDLEISKEYLDLFEKYRLLFEVYENLKNNCVFRDGPYGMYTEIDNIIDTNILDGLKKFKIYFGDTYMNAEYFTKLSINLGEEFGIDYDNCSYKSNLKKIPLSNDDYMKILKNTYINREYVKDEWLKRVK